MKAKQIAKQINNAGRPPRPGVDRYDNGRIKEGFHQPKETPEEIQATVLSYRKKLGVPEDKLHSRLAESAFGRMRMTNAISSMQYAAGCRYARVIERRRRLVDDSPSPFPRPIDLDGGPPGRAGRPEPEPDQIDAVLRDYEDAMYVLGDLAHSETYRGTKQILLNVILFDQALDPACRDYDAQLGNLRSGLNVLARMFGMMG